MIINRMTLIMSICLVVIAGSSLSFPGVITAQALAQSLERPEQDTTPRKKKPKGRAKSINDLSSVRCAPREGCHVARGKCTGPASNNCHWESAE
jgi:hypothetical protein